MRNVSSNVEAKRATFGRLCNPRAIGVERSQLVNPGALVLEHAVQIGLHPPAPQDGLHCEHQHESLGEHEARDRDRRKIVRLHVELELRRQHAEQDGKNEKR